MNEKDVRSKAEDERFNEAELRAWMLWKKICSVGGCKGTPEAYRILEYRVNNTFVNQIQKICGDVAALYWKLDKPTLDTPDAPIHSKSNRSSHSDDDDLENTNPKEFYRLTVTPKLVQAFDVGLLAPSRQGEGQIPHKPIPYKDAIWQKVVESEGNALKVIRGKLTGRHSHTNDIVVQFLRQNYDLQYYWSKDPHKRRKLLVFRCRSLNAIMETGKEPYSFQDSDEDNATYSDPCTWEDLCHDDTQTSFLIDDPDVSGHDTTPTLPVIEEEIREHLVPALRKKLQNTPGGFDYRAAAVLLAHLAGLPITDRTVLHFCGIGKTMAYNLLNRKGRPFLSSIQRDEDISIFFLGSGRFAAARAFYHVLYEIAKEGNEAEGFLSYIEENK